MLKLKKKKIVKNLFLVIIYLRNKLKNFKLLN